MDDEAERLRAEQVRAFIADDFAGYHAATERLAAASPGFARSYEFWIHTVLHALPRVVADPTIVQIGAMDGKRFDPIYAFVKHYGWRATLLEPLPDLFATLSDTYRDCPSVALVNAALLPIDGPATMTRIDRSAVQAGGVPLWAEGLGSVRPERNALGGVGVDADLHAALLAASRIETVDGIRLDTLMARQRIGRVDLLQVDAEGCELDVLRQCDGAGQRPAVVHLEHWALPADERRELIGTLAGWGHTLRMGEADVMAIAPELRSAIDDLLGWSC